MKIENMIKMKNLLVAIVMIFTVSLSAQIDLKINPIGLLFNSPDISAEYMVSDELGVQLSLGLDYGKIAGSGILGIDAKKSGYRVNIMGKYYFSPDDGCDKFYAGLYLGPRSRKVKYTEDATFNLNYKISAFTAGLATGYKWVGDSGFVFEIGIGAGRAFGEKIKYEDSNNTNEEGDGFGFGFYWYHCYRI